MRTRRRDSQLGYPDAVMSFKTYTGQTGQNSLMNVTETSEVMTDRKTPGFFTASKAGKIIPVSPMSRITNSMLLVPGNAVFLQTGLQPPNVDKTYRVEAENCLFAQHSSANFPVVPRPSVDKAALLQKALATAQTDAWDTLTFAAEFHKTVDMLRTAKDRYSKHWEKVYSIVAGRRRPSGVQSSQQEMFSLFSEVWLEYRFGLRPLIYDMEAIAEAVKRLANGIPTLARGHADQVEVETRVNTRTTSQLNGYRWFNGSQHVLGVVTGNSSTFSTFTRTIEVEGRASVGVEILTRGVTADDGFITAWELMPWSVFIDYFTNIGEAIAAFSPFASGKFAFATYSETITDTRTALGEWRARSDAVAKAELVSFQPSSSIQVEKTYTRTLETVKPDLSLSFDLNLSQILDLIAVFGLMRIGQLKKLKRLSFRR